MEDPGKPGCGLRQGAVPRGAQLRTAPGAYLHPAATAAVPLLPSSGEVFQGPEEGRAKLQGTRSQLYGGSFQVSAETTGDVTIIFL